MYMRVYECIRKFNHQQGNLSRRKKIEDFFCFPFSLSSRRVLLRSVTQKVYDLPTLLKG